MKVRMQLILEEGESYDSDTYIDLGNGIKLHPTKQGIVEIPLSDLALKQPEPTPYKPATYNPYSE